MQPAERRAAPQTAHDRAVGVGHAHGQRPEIDRAGLAFVEPDERRRDLLADVRVAGVGHVVGERHRLRRIRRKTGDGKMAGPARGYTT
jgi:hypothetical protein